MSTVSALLYYAHSIFLNDSLGRTLFKFCANSRIVFKKIAQRLDFWPKNARWVVNAFYTNQVKSFFRGLSSDLNIELYQEKVWRLLVFVMVDVWILPWNWKPYGCLRVLKYCTVQGVTYSSLLHKMKFRY